MALFLSVFCRSAGVLTRAELAEFCDDGWYEDEDLTFDPPAGDEALAAVDWSRLDIIVPGQPRPISVTRDVGDAVTPYVTEAIDEIADAAPAAIVEHLRATAQILAFEVAPDRLGDNEWELLDSLEAWIAQRFDGIVVTDDGIYDKDLTVLIAR